MDAVSVGIRANKLLLNGPITEADWNARKDCCNNLSDLLNKGHVLPSNFAEQIEPYYNGLFDCAICERTTLSTAALKALTNVARLLGKDLQPHLDRFLPPLLRLCASTKPITATSAAITVTTIVEHATYHQRLLYHICHTFEEISAGPKRNACIWLQTILKSYYKSITTDREYQMISRAVSKALEDADPTTRTNARATYWTYRKLDLVGADAIMDKLNKQARTALQNDPHNPDKKSDNKTSKEAPRPRSALALMKAEAKKKRAVEETQQRQPVRPEKIAEKSSDRDHEKTTVVEQDIHLDHTKAPSRLLSAPVRRPRVMATPLPTAPPRPQYRPETKTDIPRVAPASQVLPITETADVSAPPNYGPVPEEKTRIEARPVTTDDVELVKARTLIDSCTRQLRKQQLDMLGFKKLKASVEKYISNLFTSETQYDDLVGNLIDDLHCLNKATKLQPTVTQLDYNSLYMQKAALQILIPLLSEHPYWASKWTVSFVLWTLVFRNSLTEGPKDLRIVYVDKLIQAVVSTAIEPVALLDALAARPDITEPQLNTLTLIMQRLLDERLSLHPPRSDVLCNLVTRGLRSTLKVKSTIVPYIRTLYILMNDDDGFLAHFTEDAETNLLEYYLADLRPRWS